MVEMSIAVIAAVAAGFALAWTLRGLRATAELAAAAARCQSLEQQHAQRLAELDALKASHSESAERHRVECERRASFEAVAA